MDELEEPLSEEDARQFIDEIASAIVQRKLEVPAVLFLEMNKPLSFVAGQSLIVAMPFLGPIVGPERMARLSRFLRDRENVERLIQRIEDMSEESDK